MSANQGHLLSLAKMKPEAQKKVAEVLSENKELTLAEAKKTVKIHTESKKKKRSLYKDGPNGSLDFLKNVKDYVSKRFEKYEENEIEGYLT